MKLLSPIKEAGVTSLKSEVQQKEVTPTLLSVRPHIAYLDFLKKHRLLEQAIEGTLPKDVERAAKLSVASDIVQKHGKEKVRVFRNTEGDIAISVDAQGKDLEQAEINDYIQHYRMDKFVKLMDFHQATREISIGSKFEIKSGTYFNRCVLVNGLDRDVYGVDWHENFGHPLCEGHLTRVQRDNLPMRGRVFVCKLLDDKTEALIHESEIGLHII